MNKYMIVLQICAILFICFIVYFLYKFVNSLIKKNRLSYFSLDIKKDECSNDSFVFKYIYKFAQILESLVVFNGLAKTYDKYVYYDIRFRKGMDFVSVKVLGGLLFIGLYLFITFLYKDVINSWLILITFVLGFILLDFYCIFVKRKSNEKIDVLIIPILLDFINSLKSLSVSQSLNDIAFRNNGIIKKEFEKVLSDVKLGLNIGEAFNRMYKRTGSKVILNVSNMFILVYKNNINLLDCLDDINDMLLNADKNTNEIKMYDDLNRIALVIFSILPVIFISTIVMFNIEYRNILVGDCGIFILSIIGILYLLYLLIINYFVRSCKYDK